MVGNIRTGRSRIISAAFALLGVIHFAALVPNHVVSELNHFLFAADYGSFADFICESGKSKPRPGGKTSSCPFCKGLAAFQLAVIAVAPVLRPLSDYCQRLRVGEAAATADSFLIRVRNRGPPVLAS